MTINPFRCAPAKDSSAEIVATWLALSIRAAVRRPLNVTSGNLYYLRQQIAFLHPECAHHLQDCTSSQHDSHIAIPFISTYCRTCGKLTSCPGLGPIVPRCYACTTFLTSGEPVLSYIDEERLIGSVAYMNEMFCKRYGPLVRAELRRILNDYDWPA